MTTGHVVKRIAESPGATDARPHWHIARLFSDLASYRVASRFAG